MTPEESNILRYLKQKDWASTHELAKKFRVGLPAIELRMRSLLSHDHVELDANRYYRATEIGKEDLTRFDDHWIVKPFDDSRRPI